MNALLGTHFGTYESTPDGLRPFHLDPAPSKLGEGLLELADHPIRIRAPMIRAGFLDGGGRGTRGADAFVRVDWDTAIDRVAAELRRVIDTHGNEAIFAGSYGWASAGRFHHAQSQLKRMLNLLGGFTTSVNSYSYGAAAVLIPHVLGPAHTDAGSTAPSWDQIAAHTDLLLAFGGIRPSNAQVDAGGVGQHTIPRWLARAVARGMRLVVVSPNRDDLPADVAGEHIPIRPNTDAALMLAMAQTLLAEGRVDHAWLARYTEGAEIFLAYVTDKTAEWAAPICGIPAETIRTLARQLQATKSLINLAWSLQRARHGEQPYWAAVALACCAGHVGQPGGGFAFGLGAVNSVGQPVRRLRFPAVPQGENRVRAFIPVARIADLLLNPGGTIDYNGRVLPLPDIRLVYWAGGNPFHHHQDINRLRRAWARPETIIVHESVWTATARHADIVLPVPLPHEREDIAVSSRDRWIVASRRLATPPQDVRTDHAICAAIAERFGLRDAFTEGRDEAGWLRAMYDRARAEHPALPDYDSFLARGYVAPDEADEAPAPHTPFADFVRDPIAHPLDTPSGRIHLASATIAAMNYDDCPGHPAWLPPEERAGSDLAGRYPLHLLSPQPVGRLHSQLDPAAFSRAGKIAGHETLFMNPEDAAARGIADGAIARVFNDRGACLVGVAVTDALMPGVVSLVTGAWYDPLAPEESGTLDLHGNPNVLTPDNGTSKLSQGPAPNTCLVEIAPVAANTPAPRPHLPPDLREE